MRKEINECQMCTVVIVIIDMRMITLASLGHSVSSDATKDFILDFFFLAKKHLPDIS